MLARITSSKFTLPVAIAAAGLGYYAYNNTPIRSEASKIFKGDDQWVDLKLINSKDITHDTKHLTFSFDNKDAASGLVTASCLLTKFVTAKGNNVVRPYTPVSDPNQKGTLDLVVKVYPTGKMSKHIAGLKEGETLSFKGPIVKWKWEPNQFDEISLIGGGSGITPLWQLLETITSNPNDKTKVQLFYGSATPDDIILKPEIDTIAKAHPEQVKVHYFVTHGKDDAAAGITGGNMNKEVLQKYLPAPSKQQKIFICGPLGLLAAFSGTKDSPTDQGDVTGILGDLGYTKENVFKF